MLRSFLKAKIRDIRLTATNIDYEGSILLDEDYLERAGIAPFEQVHVLNIESGARITTYALRGKRGSGVVELNGAAARSGQAGDRVMVLAYCLLSDSEVTGHKPVVLCATPSRRQAGRGSQRTS
jgi:aspartate 1-decarboxylase